MTNINTLIKKYGWIPGGLLFGLSFPAHEFPLLGWLAPLALVPLLLSVLDEKKFRWFLAKTFGAFFIFVSTALWWVYPTNYAAMALATAFVGLCYSVPVLLLYPARKLAGPGFALLLLPFTWGAWEWLYSLTQVCIPLLFFGHTQSVSPYLVQYVSYTGVWGASFWLVACNALFTAVAYNLAIKPGLFDPRRLTFLAILLTLPPLFSVYLFLERGGHDSAKPLNILLVQTNNMEQLDEPAKVSAYLKKLDESTSTGLLSSPDLIVWPEAALPIPLFKILDKRDLIFDMVKRWNRPLLTGVDDAQVFDDDPLPDEKAYWDNHRQAYGYFKQNYDYYNSAAMITPELARFATKGEYIEPKTYRKRKPFPFVEFIPYIDQFPFLAKLKLSFRPDTHNFSIGEKPEAFVFKSGAGDKVRIGTLICFEEFYSEMAADLSASGAQVLAVIGNEWLFLPDAARRFNMMASGMRAIETGVPVVRDADNGYLAVTNHRGETIRLFPTEQKTAVASVHPSAEKTLYTLHKHWFPSACLLVIGFLSLVRLLSTSFSFAAKPVKNPG